MLSLFEKPELYPWLTAAGEYALTRIETSAGIAQKLREEYGDDTYSFAADVMYGSVEASGAVEAIGEYLRKVGVIDADWNLQPNVPPKKQASRLTDLDPAITTEFQTLIDHHKLEIKEDGAFLLNGERIRVIGSVLKSEKSPGKSDCLMSAFLHDGRRCRLDNTSCWATGEGGKILLLGSATSRGDLLICGLAQKAEYSLHAPSLPAVAVGIRIDGKQATNMKRPLAWRQRPHAFQGMAGVDVEGVQQINSTHPAFVAAVLTDNVNQETTIAFFYVDKARPSSRINYWIVDHEGSVLLERNQLEFAQDEDGKSWSCRDVVHVPIPEDASLLYELTK